MRVYRIEKASRTADWPSQGALFAEGRWNAKGFWIIYCSASVSLAKLEILANARTLPKERVLVEILISDQAPIHRILPDQLPGNWMDVPYPRELHELSKKFLRDQPYAALSVPSRQSPTEQNILLYPPHPKFNEWVTLENVSAIDFDPRLKEK